MHNAKDDLWLTSLLFSNPLQAYLSRLVSVRQANGFLAKPIQFEQIVTHLGQLLPIEWTYAPTEDLSEIAASATQK